MSMFANPGSKLLLISFIVKAKLALAIDYKGRLVSCPIAPSLHPNSLISHVFDVCLENVYPQSSQPLVVCPALG